MPLFGFGNYWGKTGHRITGKIAEHHLTAKTRRALKDLLGGHSLAFATTFADEIKADRKNARFSPWHYVNYPLGMRYEDSEKSPYGDLMVGMETCIRIVKDKNSPREDRIFYLKMLVHLIGDMHQPMHASRGEDRGGNDIQLQWFGEATNLHRLWDKNLIVSYGMTYTELADELNRVSRKERKQIQMGTIYDWIHETHELAVTVYNSASSGDKLGYKYAYDYNSLLFQQLQRGGLRMAKVLNELFR